ncbi:hypothetical protein DFP86_107206 [Paludibacterium purpuratum]|uniref:DUF6396 domain-containing protein n=2 Tax=Paludibacterium purpuratum TaxID=1144873 RepID=A0A4V3DV67_9NEIS|nr:hypothetical protein DFP86_107206 [Paludibacterium purpuratum]
MKDLSKNNDLSFTCTSEPTPSEPQDADILFKYARWLETKRGPKNFPQVARFYRIAAWNGHYKANRNLRNLILAYGDVVHGTNSELYDLNKLLLDRNIPVAYFNMGNSLDGGRGVARDPKAALRYYKRAADLGNPEAQYLLGDKLTVKTSTAEVWDVGQKMRVCAAKQGHKQAILDVIAYYRTEKKYNDAIALLQIGVRNGDGQSAFLLSRAFSSDGTQKGTLFYFGQSTDLERSKRYATIYDLTERYFIYNPKVPDIDKIAPLPPAPLPKWDGTFQWEKEYLNRPNLPVPNDELVRRLADAKGLDPATGLPLKSK